VESTLHYSIAALIGATALHRPGVPRTVYCGERQ